MAAEVNRYGARFVEADKDGANRWYLDGRHGEGEEPDSLVDMAELETVLDQLKADVAPVVFAKGFDQVNTAELDIPFSEYLDKIGAPPAIADLLRAQSYTLTGALPEEFSALVYLREIAGFDNDPPIPSSPPWRASTSAAAAWRSGSPTRSATTSVWASRSPR